MAHFTKTQIEEIRAQLATNAKRDSTFDTVSTLDGNEYVPILQDSENKKVTLETIENRIYDEISDNGIDGKILSENDFTTALLAKLNGIQANAQVNADNTVIDSNYVHTDNNFTSVHKAKVESVETGARVNVIETIKVNGNDSPIADKTVNIDLSGYAPMTLVPEAASEVNKLADKAFVNSSIATATAEFLGTSAEGLGLNDFLAWAYSLDADSNDYVYWNTVDDAGNAQYRRYKFNGSDWVFEYALNNSSFTAAEWAAIQSGINTELVQKLTDLPTVENVNAAITSANNAASLANQKANSANSAAIAANTATTNANAATSSANDAATRANAAAANSEADHTIAVQDHEAVVAQSEAVADAEALRVSAEGGRVLAENARVSAEAARVSAESLRVSAEAARVTAEEARETRATEDHNTAAADHTTAVADHTIVQGYDTRLTNVEGEVSQLGQKVDGNVIKDITWSNGYVQASSGLIKASSLSQFSQPILLKAGETVTIGTQNSNIGIICSTNADSVAVGDAVTIIKSTSSSGQFETYEYTASADIKIVLCVLASNYTLSFYDSDNLTEKVANSATKEELQESEAKVGMVSIPITESGKYVETNTGVGNQIGAIISNASYKYMRFSVGEGDKVIVNGTGGGTPRLWCFIDNADKIISVANADQSATNLELIVPQNATAIIINDNSNGTSYYIKKDSSEQLIINTNKRIDNIDKEYSLIKPSLKLRDPENYIFNPTVGYITKDGTISDSSSYKWITVDNVEEGDIITCWNVGEDLTQALVAMRFICAYDTNGDAVSAKGADTTTDTYTVPSGIKKLAISLSATYFVSPWDRQVMIIKGATAPQYFKVGVAPLYEAEGQIIPDQLSNKFKSGIWRFTRASSIDGDTQQTRECHIVKNLIYTFTAKVTSFYQLSIGQDSSLHNYFSLCTIDNTKVIFNINGNTHEYEHGLTIAHYINIRLVENDNTRVTLTLESNGGTYTRSIGWYGFGRGGAYRYLNTNCVLSDVVFTVSCRDLKDAPVHIHGDSYIAILESDAKWTHWLVADGYGDNALINAFPGASSTDLMESLKNIIEKGLPRVILWACGMNDGADTDSSTPNATWLAKIQDVITICKQNGIEPVLATIPTVPSILHEAKNDWVRNSGYRYVDFAKAVGADASGVWYADMLSQDNVHPTTLGAKALYHRVLCDLPDVTFRM